MVRLLTMVHGSRLVDWILEGWSIKLSSLNKILIMLLVSHVINSTWSIYNTKVTDIAQPLSV